MMKRTICGSIRQVSNGFIVEMDIDLGPVQDDEIICTTWEEVVKLLTNAVIPPMTITTSSWSDEREALLKKAGL